MTKQPSKDAYDGAVVLLVAILVVVSFIIFATAPAVLAWVYFGLVVVLGLIWCVHTIGSYKHWW